MTPELINRIANHAVARQVMRFVMVGAVATGVHYSILVTLVEFGHLRPVIATTIGYSIGIIVSYTLNRRFTFAAHDKPVASTFVKFAVLYGIGMALNAAMVGQLVSMHVPYLAAQLCATAVVLFWNFLGARFVAFR